MSHRPTNPIERRKQDVRRHARYALWSVGGGIAGGVLCAFLFSYSWVWLVAGLVVAVVGGGYNYLSMVRIARERDDQ